MEAERAVDFDLFLREKLVTGGLMRERRMTLLVIEDVILLIASERRFEIDDNPFLSMSINDTPHRTMRTFETNARGPVPLQLSATRFVMPAILSHGNAMRTPRSMRA
jgi:hypothetical protein